MLEAILADPETGDRGDVFAQLVARLFPDTEIDQRVDDLVDRYTRLTEERVGACPKRAGAKAALQRLNAMKIPMCVSSATPRATLEKIVGLQGLAGFFQEIFGSPQSKTEHVELFARQLACSPGQLLYVGDSEIDRKSAQTTGCAFLAVGEDANRFAQSPAKLISDLSVLPELLEAGELRP